MQSIRASSIKVIPILLSLLLILLLIACSSSNPSPIESESESEVVDIQVTTINVQSSPEPYQFPTSQPGLVTLRGRLIVLDPQSILPGPDDAIFLVQLDPEAPISGIPPFDVNDENVPQANVDEITGEFVFVNIEPGRYAVVAVTMGGTQFPTRKFEDGNYSIFDIMENDRDQVVDLKDLTLP